jgi:hypothetical protein
MNLHIAAEKDCSIRQKYIRTGGKPLTSRQYQNPGNLPQCVYPSTVQIPECISYLISVVIQQSTSKNNHYCTILALPGLVYIIVLTIYLTFDWMTSERKSTMAHGRNALV